MPPKKSTELVYDTKERHGKRVLDDGAKMEIINLFFLAGWTQQKIADKYQVQQPRIAQIIKDPKLAAMSPELRQNMVDTIADIKDMREGRIYLGHQIMKALQPMNDQIDNGVPLDKDEIQSYDKLLERYRRFADSVDQAKKIHIQFMQTIKDHSTHYHGSGGDVKAELAKFVLQLCPTCKKVVRDIVFGNGEDDDDVIDVTPMED